MTISAQARDRRVTLIALMIGATSAAFRLYMVWSYLPRFFDTENMRTGFALASRGTLADPFILPTGVTAHVAPLYPALIAAGIRLTDDAELGLLFARSLLAVGFGAFLVLLPTLAAWCGLNRKAGLLATVLFAFPTPPVFAWIELTGQHETVLTTMLFAVAAAATIGTIRGGTLTLTRAGTLGAAWALAAHSSPVVAPPLIAVLATSWMCFDVDRRRLATFACALLVAFTIAVTPWTLRNARAIGGFAFIRDNFGLELAVSNADDARPNMRENMAGAMQRHPYVNRDEALRMRHQGERRYYEARSAEAKAWIRANPRRFLELTLDRVRFFFFPPTALEHHAYFYFPILALAFVWLAIAWRHRSVETLALLGALFAFAAPHFLVQSSPRYAYPVLWILVLFASSAFLALWTRVAPGFQRWRHSRRRA